MQFTDSIVLIGAAVAGLGVALGRGPHVAPQLARGQLVRVTQESWQRAMELFSRGAGRRTSGARSCGRSSTGPLQEARDESAAASSG